MVLAGGLVDHLVRHLERTPQATPGIREVSFLAEGVVHGANRERRGLGATDVASHAVTHDCQNEVVELENPQGVLVLLTLSLFRTIGERPLQTDLQPGI